MSVLFWAFFILGWAFAIVTFLVLCAVAYQSVKREQEQGEVITRLQDELRAWTGATSTYPPGRFGEHES